jgi:NAD(P)-dependent dehydrogenase (short-subunit alcohol dehydrogenase family)
LALVLRSVSRKKARTCFITDRHQSQLDEAVAMIGGDAAAIQGDTTSLANLDRIFAELQTQAGRIDVLAVNAGIYVR